MNTPSNFFLLPLIPLIVMPLVDGYLPLRVPSSNFSSATSHATGAAGNQAPGVQTDFTSGTINDSILS